MNATQQFLAALVRSTAWPICALVALIVFRRQILAVLPAIKRLRAGMLEVEFERAFSSFEAEFKSAPVGAVQQGSNPMADRKDLRAVARVSPVGAIVGAYSRIETRLHALIEQHPGLVPSGGIDAAELAYQEGLLSTEALNQIRGLRTLKSMATQPQQREVSEAKALAYLSMTEQVLRAVGSGLAS